VATFTTGVISINIPRYL